MADFDVRDFDDDGIDHSNDFTASDEGWFTPDDFPGLRDVYRFYLKHYNVDESNEIGATGTGLFNPFLNMNGDSTLRGFNTNDNIVKAHKDADLDISDPNTDAIRLGDIPIIYRDLDGNGLLEAYYLINLDINENVNTDVSLEELQLFTSSAPATLTQYRFDDGDPLAFRNSDGFTLRFDLDANADNKLLLRDDGAGQGKQDYTFYFPVELFAGSLSSDYLTLFSQFGPNPEDDAGFAEWNVLTAAQISGTKFLDRNGDGVRDADGADNNIATTADNESPLAGFTVYIDINNNNKLDANEQTALTDSNGNFTFASLLPNAQYVIREVLTAADVNGPGDLGPDVSFAAYAPPAGIWEQTTDPLNDGDQVVNVTTGTTNILVGNKLLAPDFSIDKSILSIVDGDDFGASGQIDSAGDQINYRILITNTGDLALSLTSISDMLEGIGVTVSAASFTESGTDNNILDVGETWTWDWTETVSQTELDALCADDETITNTVTATFNYNGTDIGPKGDTVNTLVVCNPDFTAVKTIVSIEGGVELLGGDPLTTADDAVDSAGDKINYRLTIVNTGNVTLDGESITDTFEGAASGLTAADFTETGGTGTNGDGILDVGETWTYDFTEEVSQAELDALCADDEIITNTLAASFTFDGETLGPKGNSVNTGVVCNPDFTAEKTIVSVFGGVELLGGDPLTTADDAVDSAGDQINYSLVIRNTGNVTLDGESITDTFEGSASGLTAADFTETGGTGVNGDGILDVGETWTYNFTETVSQAELDVLCADDETITNTLAATFVFDGETLGPKGSTVNTPVVCNPDFTAVKTIVSVEGGVELLGGDPLTTADDAVDSVGDKINYRITIVNTGNVTLDGESITDTFEGAASGLTAADFTETGGTGTNGDGILDVGETWTYDFTEEVDQAELDAACADDETITNTLAASFTFDGETVGPKGNSVNTGVVCAPLIDVEKSVKTNLSDYAAEDFDDDPDGLQASTSSTVEFKVVVTNAGNVTLSNITLSDSVVHTVGGIPQAPVAIDYSNPIYNAFIDLNGNAALDLGEEWANFDTDADGTIDAGDFAELAPNETFTLYYSLESALGQHENTAVVSGTIGVEEATDSDDANYYVLASHECVGVGTPGFWSNNGFAFWDGIALNEKHTGDPLVDGDSDPGFADGELLYAVDSDGDGDIDGDDVQGLLIGDYDHNGLNNEGDALFIKLSDAQMLINASQKQLQDGKFMLGRDAVATWLNFLANGADLDCIDGPTGPTPKDYLDDAIDWLQTYAGVLGQNTNGGQDTLDDNAKGEPFDTFFKGTLAVKTSSIVWQSPVAGVADDSAATMHSQLDAFNNTGVINGVEFCCDRDNPVALLALQQLHSADYF